MTLKSTSAIIIKCNKKLIIATVTKNTSVLFLVFSDKSFKYKKVIKIGAAANLTRKSTGYTFLNIQKFTKELVQKLIKNQIATNNQIKSKYNF